MEEKKIENNLKKNRKAEIPSKTGKSYSYQYIDIAQIHEYLAENNMSYYQYIDRIDNDDYIMTVKIIDGKELPAIRGCRVVDATLVGVSNPAQQQGSAITYARRYSLLMAFGLATEDDDGQGLIKNKKEVEISTREDALKYKINFGKHSGKTIEEIWKEDPQYIQWLWANGTDETIRKCLEIINTNNKKTEEIPENYKDRYDTK